MINDNLVEYFNNHQNSDGYVILNKNEYNYVIKNYIKDDIIDSFVEVFINKKNKNEVYKEIKYSDVTSKLLKLKNKKSEFINPTNINVVLKHEYNFNVGKCLGITQLGHHYNDISNYFHISERMKCGGYNRISPHEIWYGIGLTEKEWRIKLKGFLSPLFRSVNDKKQITKHEYRFCFRLASTVYTAAQFKPEVAKLIIDKFSKNGNVIDFSSGWGDRLAGFFASEIGKVYVGTDPNNNLFGKYQEQIKTYKKISPDKNAIVFNKPAEDLNWSKFSNYDLVFTSPPYFSTELYAKNSEYENLQSWNRYSEYDNWCNNFLFKSIKNILPALTSDAIFAINITNLKINKNYYDVGTDLYKFMLNLGFKYEGFIGMRMKQRPKNLNENINKKYMSSYMVEPIWIYKRK